MKHYSVLKDEVIEALNIRPNGIYVDATLGYAGDSKAILEKLDTGYLYAFDKDMDAINYSNDVLKKVSNNFHLIHSDFANMKEELARLGVTKVDGILFDFGVSSPQLDENRGFSFMRDEELDMRMDRTNPFSAKDVVNKYNYEKLKEIFYKYGEESKSPLIAKNIVEKRKSGDILTTFSLNDIILNSVGAKYYYQNHPERKIFQAIRIEVNKELDAINKALPDAIDLLNDKGRIAVITFHSLEDRITKNIFKEYSSVLEIFKGLPSVPKEYMPKIKVINKKVILPSDNELKENTRSASAKLRIVERISYDEE